MERDCRIRKAEVRFGGAYGIADHQTGPNVVLWCYILKKVCGGKIRRMEDAFIAPPNGMMMTS